MTAENLPALNDLAARINKEHEACQTAMRSAVEHAVRVGELLIEAKAGLPHGQWLPWLEKNCAFAERTAQAYMRLAREMPKLEPEKAQRVADLPLREALVAMAKSGSAAADVEDALWPVLPLDALVAVLGEPSSDMETNLLFDHLAILTEVYRGRLAASPAVGYAKDPKLQAQLDEYRETNQLMGISVAAQLGLQRGIVLYVDELAKRGYAFPTDFDYWAGTAPWLDLQVLTAKIGRKVHQIRTEDEIIPISVLVRAGGFNETGLTNAR